MYFEIPFSALARDIDMLLGEGRKVTHSKLFRLLSKKGSTPKGKNLFQEGFCVKESKKEVTKVVFLVNNAYVRMSSS